MSEVKHKKLGSFTTQLVEPYSDTQVHLHTSRRARKRLSKLLVDISDHTLYQPFSKPFLFSYQPKLLTWWVAVLFMIGSACFVSGSAMVLYFEEFFSSLVINLTFFIGSIFFTTAAYGQLLEVINADISNKTYLSREESPWLWWAWRPKNLGYIASISQFIGTLLFNFNTFDAFYVGLSVLQEDVLIWVPNMLGSILFLTASFFAWLEVYHDKQIKAFFSVTWWIIWINILGSIFFQLSAILSYVYLDSGKLVDGTRSLEYTLYGAVCFFVGAYLLIVEMNETKQAD